MRKIFAKIMILVILTMEMLIPASQEVFASDRKWTGCNPTFITTEGRGMMNGYFKSSDTVLVSIPGATMDTTIGKDGITNYPYRYGGIALADTQPKALGELSYAFESNNYNLYKLPGTYTGSEGKQYAVAETVGGIKASELAKFKYIIGMQGKSNGDGGGVGNVRVILAYKAYEIKLDDTKPNVSVATCGAGKDGSSYSGVKVSVTATDAQSKIGSNAYSFSYDEQERNWQSEATYVATENGTLYIKVRDNVGNETASSVEISGIDATPPVIEEVTVMPVNPVLRDGNPYAKSAVISISANDAEAGLHSEAYACVYGDSISDDSIEFSDSEEFVVSQNGVWSVVVRDAALNETSGTIEISCIDNEGPVVVEEKVSCKPDVNGYGREALIAPVIEEYGCGFSEQPFSFDGGQSYTNESSITVYENGTYNLVYKDALENITSSVVSVNCIDREDPEIIQIADESKRSDNGYAREAVVRIVAADKKSGLHSEAYSLDKGASYQSSDTFNISAEGDYEATVRDGLGNRTEADFSVTKLDREAPIFVKRTIEPVNPKNGYGLQAEINVSACDYKSGLDVKAFSYDEGKTYVSENRVIIDSNKICTVMARDAVGNVAKSVIDAACVDSQGPGIVISGNPTVTVNSDVTLTVSLSDTQSGISSLWYQNDSVKSKTSVGSYSGAKSAKAKVTIKQNGSYTFFAYDELGNMAKKTISVTKIDRSSKNSSSSKSSTTKSSTSTSSKKSTSSSTKKSSSSSTVKTSAVIIGGSSDKDDNEDSANTAVKNVTIKSGSGSEKNTKRDDSGSIGTKTLVVGLSDNSAKGDGDSDSDSGALEDEDVSDISDVILNDDASDGTFYGMESEYSEGVYEEKLSEGPTNMTVSQERIVPNSSVVEKSGASPLKMALIVIVVMLIILGLITAFLIKAGVIPAAQILADLRSRRENAKENREDPDEEETDLL